MIKCRLVENKDPLKLQPGDMFYFLDHLIVILPNGGWFDLNWAAEVGDGAGTWEVTGEPPNITVKPSINSLPSLCRPGWHGWLKNGGFIDA